MFDKIINYSTNKPIFLLVILLLIVASGIFVATIWLGPSWTIGSDGFGYYAYARSVIFDHDLDLTNEMQLFDQQFGLEITESWRTNTGKVGNPFAIGASILWLPFVALAYFVQEVFNLKDPYPLPGYNLPFQVAIAVGTWVYVLAGLGLLFSALRRLVALYPAWLATLAIVGIAALPYYLIYEPSMAHGLSFFTTALLFYVTIRFWSLKNISFGWLVLLGLVIGLVFLVRWQNILYALIPLVLLIKRTRGWLWLWRWVVLGGSFVIVAVWQLAVWRYLYGSWVAVPQGTSFFQLLEPHLFEFLLAGHHGLFIIHPLLILSVIGIILALVHRQYLLITLSAVVVLSLQVYINAGLIDWHGSGSFGARRMIGAYFILAFGLAILFSRLQKKIIIVVVTFLIGLGILFNGLLMVAYAREIIKINVPTTYAEVYTAPIRLFNVLE